MKVFDLINLLAEEDPEAEVRIVSSGNQADDYDVSYCSRTTGVTQIPVDTVMLVPVTPQRRYRRAK